MASPEYLYNETSLLEKQTGITRCPSSSTISLDFPSTVFTTVVLAALALYLACLVLVKYNYITIFGDAAELDDGTWGERWKLRIALCANRDQDAGRPASLHLASVSNGYWVLFFLFTSLKGVNDALLYAINHFHDRRHAVAYLTFSSCVFESFVTLFLTLALLNQYYYRAGYAPSSEINGSESSDAGDRVRKLYRWLSPEVTIFALCLAHVLAAWWAAPYIPDGSPYSDPYSVLDIAASIQRLPTYVLLFLVCRPSATYEFDNAPTFASRCCLVVAFITDTPASLSFHTWTHSFLQSAVSWHACPLDVLSWVDIIILLRIASLLLFCAFVKSEFKRISEMESYSMLQAYSGNLIVDN
ncbi:hypothetical protein DIPPA_50564 [Diplonema papillatum]|nr:hypothetical protein DIPPA_50564 [Diplonema papillatum]